MNHTTFLNLKRAYFSKLGLVDCVFTTNCNNCREAQINLVNLSGQKSYVIKKPIDLSKSFMINYINILTFCIKHKLSRRNVAGIITNIVGIQKAIDLIITSRL